MSSCTWNSSTLTVNIEQIDKCDRIRFFIIAVNERFQEVRWNDWTSETTIGQLPLRQIPLKQFIMTRQKCIPHHYQSNYLWSGSFYLCDMNNRLRTIDISQQSKSDKKKRIVCIACISKMVGFCLKRKSINYIALASLF